MKTRRLIAVLLPGWLIAAAPEPDIASWSHAPADILQERLRQLMSSFDDRSRRGKRRVWYEISGLLTRLSASEEKALILQAKAEILARAGYPLLAGHYAAVVAGGDASGSPALAPAWKLLRQVSGKRPIHFLLEDLAATREASPHESFEDDWAFFRGHALAAEGRHRDAWDAFVKVPVASRYYLAARYAAGAMRYELGQPEDAEEEWKKIVNATRQLDLPGIPKARQDEYSDEAHLALGRLYYGQKKFRQAVSAFRRIPHGSYRHFASLFEQAWAFLLAGYPNHALGALYAVESSFFRDRFTPEAPILRSLTYFWICHYDRAQNALADFIEGYSSDVKKLTRYLENQSLRPEKAYLLFENLISGVSVESLGLPRRVLATAVDADVMVLSRDQLAFVVEERRRLERRGVFGAKKTTPLLIKVIERQEERARQRLGTDLLASLRNMEETYQRLHDQAQFLYLELLMSQKEQLLGKELHASTKLSTIRAAKNVASWGQRNDQAWAPSDKGEIWFDELGFYIFEESPRCHDD